MWCDRVWGGGGFALQFSFYTAKGNKHDMFLCPLKQSPHCCWVFFFCLFFSKSTGRVFDDVIQHFRSLCDNLGAKRGGEGKKGCVWKEILVVCNLVN